MPLVAPERVEVADRPRRVLDALETTRSAMRRYRLAMALTGAALAMIASAVVISVADLSWVLPTWARALGLAGVVLTGAGVVAWRFLEPGRRFGHDEAAEEVESAFPELGQRVRTTLEYSKPTPRTAPASPSLIGALADDTEWRSSWLEFSTVVPWSRWTKTASGLSAAVIIVLAMIAYDPTFRIAVQRLFLQPVHYTTLVVEPGDRTLKEGSDFALRATLSGRPVTSARWLQRPTGSQEAWSATPLAAPSTEKSESHQPLIGLLESVRKDCRADFEYRVVAGEVESDIYRVTVTHPLALKSLQATIEPPAYTRRKTSTSNVGNFRAPERSKVRFEIALDRAPISAKIAWTPEGSTTPKTLLLSIEGNKITGELPPIEKDIHYEVLATAADGMKLDSPRYLIKVQPDEKPSVKFLKPAESYAVTPTTEVPIKLDVKDDYGVSKVGIVYQVGDGPEETFYLDNPKEQPPSVEVLTNLYLEKHQLSYTDSLSYHAFVEDNRDPGPQRVSTELRFIDILPYKQAYQLVDGGGTSNGTSVTLEELIARQRRAYNRTFAHAEDRPISEKVADKLSKEEAELALVTSEFAQRLASEFGPISSLEDAARAMEAATVSLASKDFASSMTQEQAALTALINARKNLRKLMSTSSSAGQCRKIDRQQQQKIRKPPAAEKPKEAELAKLEQDIQKLAQEQKKFADDIDPKGGGGPELDRKDEPNPGKPSSGGGDSKPSPSERQQASVKEAERLNDLMKEDQALTDLARSRMEEAAKEIQESESSIRADRPKVASETARSAAEHLERLAQQVAGLKAKELANRIAKARDLAQATAKSERELAGTANSADKNEAIAKQHGLAEDAKSLADILQQLKVDAVEEDRSLAQAIAKASEAHPVAEIQQAMRQASMELASDQGEKSASSMKEAESHLEALARDLESARREFTQPKLQELLALERKAAEVQKALDSASDESKKAEAEKALSDLARAMGSLKAGDGPLGKAGDALEHAAQLGGTTGWTRVTKVGPRSGFFEPPISHTNAVRDISQALQAKIQEMILDDALVNRDGAVPPGYKEKVEDYFRLLSEDLR